MKLINLYSFGKGQKAQAFSLPAVTETARTADILADVKQKLGSWWFSDWLICERSYGPGDLKKKKKTTVDVWPCWDALLARINSCLTLYLDLSSYSVSFDPSCTHPAQIWLHHFKDPIVFHQCSVLGLNTCCVLLCTYNWEREVVICFPLPERL